MNTYLKYKPAWLQLLVFGSLCFGIYLVLGSLVQLFVAWMHDISVSDLQSVDYEKPGVIPALRSLQGLLTIVVFLIPSLIFAYLSHNRPLQYIGLKRPMPSNFWWLGLLLLIIAFPAAAWINKLNQDMHFPSFLKDTESAMRAAEESARKLIKAMLDMKGPADLALMLLIIALLPAIAEELFFRGVLQRLFIQVTKSPWMGIIITAMLFSAFHGQFLGFFTRMMLGILLGALYWYSGSILPSIIGHLVNNAIQVIYVYRDRTYIDQEHPLPPGFVIFSFVAILAILWYMRKISHTHYGEIYDTDDELILPARQDNQNE
ncbi:CPBP family intramembrane glutamic endopeptidase [Flavihumibacter sp. ZG627]|uniref:CPBP family intramembrane glutamic endopeptidase n=1 Tax=Flavihumibacter sp. ZG627 TaxID=1463156 RepID=UPI000694BA55|nr:CPBP family intramembrane glutamic endopeptidase [Flavihumibacter sp. ZG627]